MKRLVIFFAFLLLPLVVLPAQELRKEWRDYYRVARNDRPREQIEKLHLIRAIALERRLPGELLDACRREERVFSRMNWKGQDSLHQALTEVIESYGEPLLTWRWLDEDWEYAKANQAELGRRRNPELQPRQIPYLQTRDLDDIADDFEWILWDRLTKDLFLGPDSEEFRLLDERIGERYPNRPYLSYLMARRAVEPIPALQAVADKYADTPFRFIPEREILRARWDQLRRNEAADEASARQLYEDVNAYRKALRSRKDDIGRGLDLSVDNIRDGLTAPSLSVRFQEDSIVLTGRNFGRGQVSFESDGHSRTVTLRNRDGRFYVDFVDVVSITTDSEEGD